MADSRRGIRPQSEVARAADGAFTETGLAGNWCRLGIMCRAYFPKRGWALSGAQALPYETLDALVYILCPACYTDGVRVMTLIPSA